MGRFNTARAAAPAPAIEPAPSIPMVSSETERDSSIGQRAGFALLCLFTISPYANEFATRIFHVKAYISTVSWVLLPLLLIASGNLLRPFRDRVAWLWTFFLAWILLATPFSVWRGGSVALLLDYVPRGWIQLFYFAAFAVSLKHLRRLMFFLAAADVALLLDCFWGGSMANGRLEIPDSMFFRNANDLSLQLIIAVTQFLFLVYQRQVWVRAVGVLGMTAAPMFMLETGARGAFIAILLLAAVGLVLARQRAKLILAGLPAVALLLWLAPSGVFHRLTLFEPQDDRSHVPDALDQAALGSQQQRLALLHRSVETSLSHPLFGVGPGQFAVAESAQLAEQGKPAPWLGTHNSYTEVASECGLLAFISYTLVILLALRSNLRIYRRSMLDATDPARALAFCLFASTFVYAVCTFFFHIAYSSYLPAIAGMTVALRLAVNRRDRSA
jgi:O-antigen ligase